MAHRTRRRAVLRERREHAQEREYVRIRNIAINRLSKSIAFIIMAQHMREWVRRDWIRFSDATFGEHDECEVLYSRATPIRCSAVEILPVRKETDDSNGNE